MAGGPVFVYTEIMLMIVWDEPKRQANLAKHGLDFADLDEGFFLASVVVPAKDGRHMAISEGRAARLMASDAAQGKKHLSSGRIQAIFASEGMPLGECRLKPLPRLDNDDAETANSAELERQGHLVMARSIWAIAAACAITLSTSAGADAQQQIIQPSFDLNWGESIADVEARYQVVNRDTSTPGITLLFLAGDQFPSNTDTVAAAFSEEFGLMKVVWNSENFTEDPFGNQGKAEFDKLYDTLARKLGPGDKTTIVGLVLWNERDEFYQCLDHAGCGGWIAFWRGTDSEDSVAMLQLKGLSRGVGYLSYGVESPDWYVWQGRRKDGDASKF